MKRHLNKIITFCLCAAIFVTTAVCTPVTAKAGVLDEFVTSFTTDKNVYICGEIVGILPAGQEITVYGKSETTGSYHVEWNGRMALIYTGDETTASTASTTSTTTTENVYYNLDMAKAIFDMVNAERAEAGIAELIWNDEAYSIAMQRCVENDVHDSVRANTGENTFDTRYGGNGPITDNWTAEDFHSRWHNSKGHYDNYMNTIYDRAAVAIYYDGTGYIAYEVFLPTWYESTAAATVTANAETEATITTAAETGVKSNRSAINPEVTQILSNEKVKELQHKKTIESLKRYASYGDEDAARLLQEICIE